MGCNSSSNIIVVETFDTSNKATPIDDQFSNPLVSLTDECYTASLTYGQNGGSPRHHFVQSNSLFGPTLISGTDDYQCQSGASSGRSSAKSRRGGGSSARPARGLDMDLVAQQLDAAINQIQRGETAPRR